MVVTSSGVHLQMKHIPANSLNCGNLNTCFMAFQSHLTIHRQPAIDNLPCWLHLALGSRCLPFRFPASDAFHSLPSCLSDGQTPIVRCLKLQATTSIISSKVLGPTCLLGKATNGNRNVRQFSARPGRSIDTTSTDSVRSQLHGTESVHRPTAAKSLPYFSMQDCTCSIAVASKLPSSRSFAGLPALAKHSSNSWGSRKATVCNVSLPVLSSRRICARYSSGHKLFFLSLLTKFLVTFDLMCGLRLRSGLQELTPHSAASSIISCALSALIALVAQRST